MKKCKIKSNQTGQRLDKFLQQKLSDSSRSQIQKMIKDGLVVVVGKNVAPHHFLKAGEVIKINRKQLTINKKEDGFKDFKIKIIKETEDFLVINKPVHVLVHPVKSPTGPGILTKSGLFDRVNPDNVHQEITLVDWLIKKYPKIKDVYDRENKTGYQRPGIVHRLDRDVSGLLVMAKNQKMFDWLKNQFQKRKIKKEYLALVYGVIEKDEGEISRPIGRSKKTGLMVAKGGAKEEGKSAVTEFEVIKRFKKYTLLKLNLKTGRTHQIRVHLKSIGHSVVGDEMYQTRDIKKNKKKQKVKTDRLFLCATKLGFYDLENNWQEFEIGLPKELEEFLENTGGCVD